MQPFGLYILILGFLSGVLLRSFFTIPYEALFWLLGLVAGLIIVYRRVGAVPLQLRYSTLFIVCVVAGVVRMDSVVTVTSASELEARVNSTVTLEGTVVREPDVRTNNQQLYLRVPESSCLVLVFTDQYQSINYGDVLRLDGELIKPQAFTTELGRTFDYQGFLAARGVAYMVRYPSDVTVIDTGAGNWLIAGLLTVKEQFQTALRSVMPSPSVYLAEGVLLGEKQSLGDEWEELFRRTGVIHIVVLSGFNVMLVVAALLFVLSYVTSLRGRVIGGLVGITLFVLLVGLSPSVTRAGLMAGMVLLALMLGRSYAILRALLLAAGLMVLSNPYILVYDPGFQLSFMATLGLIVVAPYFEERLTVAPAQLGIRSYIVATVATQIAVLPLLLYHIGEASLVSVVANVLVLPAVPLAMLGAFVTGLVAMVVPLLAWPLAYLTHGFLSYILAVVAWLGSWPLAAVAVPYFPASALIVAYALLGYWWYRRAHPSTPKLSKIPKSTKSELDVSDWTIEELTDPKTGTTETVVPARKSIFNP